MRLLFFTLTTLLLFASGCCLSAFADGLEPESSLVVTSAKAAFPLDSRFPKEWWFAIDQKMDVAITSLTAGDTSITAAGQSIMSRRNRTCSIYDTAICFDTSRFYRPSLPQILLSGYAKLDGNDAFIFAIDSGFRSEKVTVTPAVMIGLTRRFYLSERRDAHFIIEAATWIGQAVNHTPCYDSYNRAYYCGNLSAWSDFTYDRHPTDLYLKVWFDYAF